MASREEEILSSMQERLQQATMNNHERRKLLFDLQTQSDSHRSLVNIEFVYTHAEC